MIAAFILNAVVIVSHAGLGIYGIVLFVQVTTAPEQGTDSMISLALFVGIFLLVLAFFLTQVACLLLTRNLVCHIVYTAIIGAAVLWSLSLGWMAIFGPDMVLITIIILIWLPPSRRCLVARVGSGRVYEGRALRYS